MSLHPVDRNEGPFAASPVFDGLEKIGQNGQNIADFVGVSPPTVSKWRNGHVAVPGETVVLLTLILASFVEDSLDAARDDLSAQEKINHDLQPSAIRSGAIRFRYWWNGRLRNQMADMQINGRRFVPAVSYANSTL